jgi:hypothetical protein
MSRAGEWWSRLEAAHEAWRDVGHDRPSMAYHLVTAQVEDRAQSIQIHRQSSGKLVLTNEEAVEVARWILATLDPSP